MMVIKNSEGQVINIGNWDYMIEEKVEKIDPPKDIALTEEELEQYKSKIVQVVKNPFPDGAYEDDVEVITGPDGGFYVAS